MFVSDPSRLSGPSHFAAPPPHAHFPWGRPMGQFIYFVRVRRRQLDIGRIVMRPVRPNERRSTTDA